MLGIALTHYVWYLNSSNEIIIWNRTDTQTHTAYVIGYLQNIYILKNNVAKILINPDPAKNLAQTLFALPPSLLDQFGTPQSAPDNPDQDLTGLQLSCLSAEMKDQNAVSF